MAGGEVVETNHFVVMLQQIFTKVGTDEAGAAGDKDAGVGDCGLEVQGSRFGFKVQGSRFKVGVHGTLDLEQASLRLGFQGSRLGFAEP
jgi:hypothetical protein